MIAPTLHAFLFGLTWLLYAIQSQPLLDGPSRWPFAAEFLGDFPISAVAFGVMFSSDTSAPYAIVAWGAIGTGWWYLLGRWMEEKQRR